jgi:hypothetical protein
MVSIEPYVERQLGLPTVKIAPFSRVSYPAGVEPLVGELGAVMPIALGLGTKEFL